MALVERIQEGGRDGSPYEQIAGHYLSATLGEWFEGRVSPAQAIAALSLTEDDQIECLAMKAVYDGLTTDGQRALYLWRIERVWNMVEAGYYGKAQAKTALGF